VFEQDRLFNVAAAVATGSDVDWDDVERQSTDGRERSLVHELRLIANIAEVARNPSSKETGSALDDAPSASIPGSWGHLRLLETIGNGSFGVVYRAWDTKLERPVALKLVRPIHAPSAFDVSRALKEARLLARVRHPNVVTVLGADCHDERFGLWMELINGLTLDKLIDAQGTMSAREAAAVGVDLCHALAAVHRAKLLHRDIKSSNVMREEGGRIVLMDFGAGRRMPAADDPVAPLAGTPLYLAPEVLAGQKPSVASDIYSLGVLLYHLVSGGYPVTGSDRHEMARAHEAGHRISLRDVRPNLSPAFIDAIERALSPDPRLRYRTAGEFGAALAALAGVGYEAEPQARATWKMVAAAGVVAAALVIGVVQVARDRARVSPGTSRPAAVMPASTATPVPGTYEVSAAFYALTNGQTVHLTAGSRVAPGDQLFLTLEASSQLFAYVINQDETGAAYLLFPLPGFKPGNPVPVGSINHLPGDRNGERHHWEITSAGGREHFFVYVAPKRLTEFEQTLETLPRAEAGRPVDAVALTAHSLGKLRGVGSVAPARPSSAVGVAIPWLADLKPLPDTPESATGIWARRITFENPQRQP
jgi:hypothetical protein